MFYDPRKLKALMGQPPDPQAMPQALLAPQQGLDLQPTAPPPMMQMPAAQVGQEQPSPFGDLAQMGSQRAMGLLTKKQLPISRLAKGGSDPLFKFLKPS